ncbi:family 20 glycosylhydrolase, partial [Deinococcus sp.]|uniref:family 20 glycosylhydrolase n=1 Tax=Deinococcus sp. TaxID=47478 RepID=UPI002869BD39
MSNYVQWDTAKTGGYAHPGGASKAEARRVAELARSYGLEPIPLIETLSHAGWMFYGGKNLDLRQDVDSQNPWAYDTLNPATYDRVVLPILKEAVDVFHPQRIHIGHDELRSRDRFPARDDGKAVGLETLVVNDITKLHDALKAQGVTTMLWHDTAFADAVVGTLPARLPKDILVAYWNYTAGTSVDMLSKIKGMGFPVLGASWLDAGNPEGMAKASVAAGTLGMIQTRWNGYFGNPSIWDGQADQGVPFVRAGSAFWNPDGPVVRDAVSVYRDLYQPTAYRATPGATVNLTPVVTRTLADPDSKGWILKGPDIDLSALKTGVARLGAYTFDVQGAVMLRGARAAVKELPERATIDINRRATTLAFLHTTGWPGALAREVIGHYEIAYADGSTLNIPLEYGRNIRAWTDTVTSSMIPAPGFTGQTRDGLSVNVPVLEWPNAKPDTVITSVTLVSEGKNANPTLIGLTLIGDRP